MKNEYHLTVEFTTMAKPSFKYSNHTLSRERPQFRALLFLCIEGEYYLTIWGYSKSKYFSVGLKIFIVFKEGEVTKSKNNSFWTRLLVFHRNNPIPREVLVAHNALRLQFVAFNIALFTLGNEVKPLLSFFLLALSTKPRTGGVDTTFCLL